MPSRIVSPRGSDDEVITDLSVLAVQMTRELQKKMLRLARKNDRTVQQEIRAALRAHVEREEN